ncbi:sigma-70 family RNA polymerase sigma factor [Duganella sp. P38]|uniref:sigma-70 family RNA polymerase sigma factor n=1 Tax=Duganella sp. P38 TaxID=3423949 RepID=UPI003D7BD636
MANESDHPQDKQDFDLSAWEAEEDSPPPDADLSVVTAVNAIQAAITAHEPIDYSTDWEDIDVYLPERSLPLARTGDAEVRERLRLLLLRAIREGSVPRMEVEVTSLNEDQSPNSEAEALLSMVINDLGAEVDERFEWVSIVENFKVFVSPKETLYEEEALAEALAFIDSLASNHCQPLYNYQKEFQREKRVTTEEEVLLGQTMEAELEKALDALAAWPRGIDLTSAAGQSVKTGQQSLTWFSLSHSEAQPEIDTTMDGENIAGAAEHYPPDDQVESNEDSSLEIQSSPNDYPSDFLEALDLLARLQTTPDLQGADWHTIRAALSSLRLNRRFLLQLNDAAGVDSSIVAAQYACAMNAYQRARERMTVANLKLVFHLAKKYLYSGEPLDDLAQEGNIGLMKAVERFDWRRGFKFSTYATWWIRQQIGRHVADKCKTIRVPVHVYEKAQRLHRETQSFEAETGRTPELDEIAAKMDMPAHKVAALQCLSPEPLPIHEMHIDELIAVEARSDFISPDPEEIVSASQLSTMINRTLSTLKPKEEQVLRLRFGIGVEGALTLEEIGIQYGVTRERVRQIEASAIRKMKQPSRIDVLARAAFGSPHVISSDKGEAAEHESSEHSIQPMQTEQPATTETTSTGLNGQKPIKSSSIDRLLTQAAELGILVDNCKDTSGRIWVHLINASDSPRRKLTRKLLALGFEFSPEKGYWK